MCQITNSNPIAPDSGLGPGELHKSPQLEAKLSRFTYVYRHVYRERFYKFYDVFKIVQVKFDPVCNFS